MESEEKAVVSAVCGNCRKSLHSGRDENCDERINKCRQWINNCSISDEESVCSDSTSISLGDSLEDKSLALPGDNNVCMADKVIVANSEHIVLDNIVNKKPNHYENIKVFHSQNVHIGDVTHINGPVYINQLSSTINQKIVVNNNNNNIVTETKPPQIMPRITWLAQPPLDEESVEYFTKPVKYVIINHTATEEGYTQTDNNLIIRLIQQFHIESRKWNDIAYNFLLGADGTVYEGRGWKTVGSHTYGYNFASIGIGFIGCYMKKLPPPHTLKNAQRLIKYGVEIGAIAEDYILLGARQCTSTESPGKRLFEEIQTWDHWDGSYSVLIPPPTTGSV